MTATFWDACRSASQGGAAKATFERSGSSSGDNAARCPARVPESALAVLRRLTGLLETGLLALDDAGVTREQPGLLERRAVGLDVHGVQAAGHAETQRTGLAGDATAVDAGDDVEATLELQLGER